MRQIIQQNPALLPALLQQLGRDNPQLLQVNAALSCLSLVTSAWLFLSFYFCLQQITQHQERFVQMLNEPPAEEAEAAEAAEAQAPPQTNYIQVTQQEKEAIERV